MFRERVLWLLLALVVTAGLLAGLFGQRVNHVEVALAPGLPTPLPAADGRFWRPFPGTEEASHALGTDLARPALLTAGAGGSLYLVDYGDLRVKELTADLDVARVFAPPPVADGETPLWQTVQPMDLAFADDRLWVSDPQARQILAFRSDGSLDRILRLEKEPFRIAAFDDGRLTVLVPNANGHVFETYGRGDEPLHRFGRLVETDLQMPYTLDGVLLAEDGGGFVYVLRNRSLLAAFDRRGEVRYLVTPVAAAPTPRMVEDGGALRGDREAPVALLDATLHEGTLYVVNTEGGRPGGAGVVDLYTAADGTYLHSWRLPEPWNSLAISGDLLHVITRTAVKSYRWRSAVATSAGFSATATPTTSD